MRSHPAPDLAALEALAEDSLTEARQLQAQAEAKSPDVDRTHAVTQSLRSRNRWASLIEDVMGGR